MQLLRVALLLVFVCLLVSARLQAQKASCNFKIFALNPANLRNPESQSNGVNDNRTVVGIATYYSDRYRYWAFVRLLNGTTTYWRPAGAVSSSFSARNNLGNTVGSYVDSSGIGHAVYLHGSTITKIAHPKAAFNSTSLRAINKYNTILGTYSDLNQNQHIFKRYSNGSFADIPNFPGATFTSPWALNDNGVIVGTYFLASDPAGISHGFIYHDGTWAKLNYRNKRTNTELTGISDSGVIVGNQLLNGFLYDKGVFKDIVGPNGESVRLSSISPDGIITGDMRVSNGIRGFTAVCQ